MNTNDDHLCLSRFLKTIELELNPDIPTALKRLSERSGRSINNITVEYLDRALGSNPIEPSYKYWWLLCHPGIP